MISLCQNIASTRLPPPVPPTLGAPSCSTTSALAPCNSFRISWRHLRPRMFPPGLGVSLGKLMGQVTYDYNVGPPVVMWTLVNKSPNNWFVISTINHSDIGVINQLSYLGGPTLYPLVNWQFAVENGPVEIVDLPIKNGGSSHSYATVYQAGYPMNGGINKGNKHPVASGKPT